MNGPISANRLVPGRTNLVAVLVPGEPNLGVWGGDLNVTGISHSLIQILKNHWTGWKKQFALPVKMKEYHIEGCLTEDRGRGWHASCVGKNWVCM